MLQENERGVSPVIGIILMVAVTVGLVALAATIVFDLGSNVNEPADVSGNVAFDESEDIVTAEVIRNENAESISVRWTGKGNTSTTSVKIADGVGKTGTGTISTGNLCGVKDGATLPGGSHSGVAELVANVKAAANEQVVETVEYTVSCS